MKDDKKRQYRPNLGSVAGYLAPSAVGMGVGIGTLASISSRKKQAVRPQDEQTVHNLMKKAKDMGADVRKSDNPMMPAFAWKHGDGKGFIDRVSREQVQKMTGSTAEKGVAMSPNVRPRMKAGIFAHELGHVEQHAALRQPLYHAIGSKVPGLGAAYVASTSDEDKARRAAVVSTASAVPMLASEVDASRRGRKILKAADSAAKIGGKGNLLRHMSPFAGVASYAAIAAAPTIAYKTKKALGGYKPKAEEKKLSARDRLDTILFAISKRKKKSAIRPMLAGGQVAGDCPGSTSGFNARDRLNSIIKFGWMDTIGNTFKGPIGKKALEWGGIGAGAGALVGGIAGGLSDDPNRSALGGALKGAATGGAIGVGAGALKGSGMINGIFGKEAASAQTQQAAQQAANIPAGNGSRFSNVEEAVRHPVDPEDWNNLHPNVQRRARGVAGMYNDPGYEGDRTAAGNAYKTMRERYNFSARETLDTILFADPRPRNPLGEFSGSEEGPNPAAIAAVYKQPGALKQNLIEGAAGGVGFAGATAAVSGLKGLANKLRTKKLSARDKLDSIIRFGSVLRSRGRRLQRLGRSSERPLG